MPDTPNDQPTGDLPSNDDGVLARWMDAVNAEDAAQADDKAGDQIGAYKLLRQLGEGGFGTVWLAERKQPFTQRVALKLIKPGMDSKSVIARFEQERQALAVMNHPGIAKVLDGGLTPKGRPYFAMEFVKGEPLTDFCDHNHLSIRDRLELFAQACEAVQHAHLKGIVHRDLKPSNILAFAVEGEKPRLKVIDFGVAKAMSQTLTEKTIFTETGQMIGTPAYMSPEQADPSLNDIDTRSDVYSLGVLLYELVTGALPFDPMELRSKGIGEIQRIIREEEPPTPSARLTTLALKDLGERAAIERARGVAVDDLARQLRSELEWIPLKAMRKEPHRRYQTAAALAEEVRSYLEGRPLLAAPESSTYRLKKYMLRNRALLAGASAVGVALLIGLTAAVLLYVGMVDALANAEQANTAATESRKQAEKNLNDMKDAKADAEAKARLAEERRQEAERSKDELRNRAYFENIQVAGILVELGDTGRLLERLSACDRDQQNWEWSYLSRRSDESLQTLSLDGAAVRSVTFGPQGGSILSLHRSDRVALWKANTGKSIVLPAERCLDATFGASDDELFLLQADGVKAWRRSWDTTRPTECTFNGDDGRILWIPGTQPRVVVADSTGRFSVWSKSSTAWKQVGSDIPCEDKVNDGFDKLEYRRTSGPLLLHMRGTALRGYDISARNPRNLNTYGPRCAISASSANGETIATAMDATFTVWHGSPPVMPESEQHTRTTEERPITGLQVSAAGDLLAVARRSQLEVWQVKDSGPELMFRDMSFASKDVSWMDFSPDGAQIAWGTSAGTLHIRPVQPVAGTRVLRGHTTEISSGAWQPDGALLVTASEDGEIRLWDPFIPNGMLRVGGTTDAGSITSLCASTYRAGCQVAFSSGSTAYYTRNADRPECLRQDMGNAQIQALALDQESPRVAIATNERKLHCWTPDEENPISEIGAFDGRAELLRFIPKRDQIALASSDGKVYVFDIRDRRRSGAPISHAGKLTQIEFDVTGKYMATVARVDGLCIRDVSRGFSTKATFPPPDDDASPEVLHATFDQQGTSMTVVTARGSVYQWDWASGTRNPVLDVGPSNKSLASAAWDADHRLLLTVDRDGAAHLQNPESTGSTPLFRKGLSRGVQLTGGMFLPSVKGMKPRVLTTSEDGAVQLWDVETGLFLLEFPAATKTKALVCPSPDGTRCLIGTGDGTIRVLDVVPYRIRLAESQLRDQETPPNLGRLYLDEKHRGDPSSTTWLTDPSKDTHRPKSFLRTMNDLR